MNLSSLFLSVQDRLRVARHVDNLALMVRHLEDEVRCLKQRVVQLEVQEVAVEEQQSTQVQASGLCHSQFRCETQGTCRKDF